MPDLQNLGWSTKLRKLFTESHCVNCYVSSLWKVASYSTMAPSFLVGSKDQCLGILEILPIKTTREKTPIIDGRLFEKFEETHLSSDGGAIPHFYRKEREKEGHCQISDFSGSLKGRWKKPIQDLSRRVSGLDGYTNWCGVADLRGRRRNVEMSPRALEVEKNCFRLFPKMASQRGLVTSFTCLIQVSCWPSKRANLFPPKNQSSAPSSQKYVSPIDAKGIPTQRWWHGDTTLAKLIACGKWHLLTPLERLLWGAKTVTWEFEMSPVWLQRHIKRSHMNHQ